MTVVTLDDDQAPASGQPVCLPRPFLPSGRRRGRIVRIVRLLGPFRAGGRAASTVSSGLDVRFLLVVPLV